MKSSSWIWLWDPHFHENSMISLVFHAFPEKWNGQKRQKRWFSLLFEVWDGSGNPREVSVAAEWVRRCFPVKIGGPSSLSRGRPGAAGGDRGASGGGPGAPRRPLGKGGEATGHECTRNMWPPRAPGLHQRASGGTGRGDSLTGN